MSIEADNARALAKWARASEASLRARIAELEAELAKVTESREWYREQLSDARSEISRQYQRADRAEAARDDALRRLGDFERGARILDKANSTGLKGLMEENADLLKRLGEAVEIARPFAKAGAEIPAAALDAHDVEAWVHGPDLNVGHFRAAAALVEREGRA